MSLVKKQRLVVTDPLEDITLLGITTALKPHQFAWLINRFANLQLTRVADLCFEGPGHTINYTTHFLFATEHCTYKLLKNRGRTENEEMVNYLVSYLKHVDFFFFVQDFTQTFNADKFCGVLRATSKITCVMRLDLKMYKDKMHLFFH